MAIPSKKRMEAERQARLAQVTPAHDSQHSHSASPARKPSKWLPEGFTAAATVSEGEHVCQIMYIEGVTNKYNGNFTIKLNLRTSKGVDGVIRLIFFRDPGKEEINERNSTIISAILAAAGLQVNPGVEPNWFELSGLLGDIWFRVKVAHSKGGFPFLDYLEVVSAGNTRTDPSTSWSEAWEALEPEVDLEDHHDSQESDMHDRTFDDVID